MEHFVLCPFNRVMIVINMSEMVTLFLFFVDVIIYTLLTEQLKMVIYFCLLWNLV